MTFREKIIQEHPEMVNLSYVGGVKGCPWDYDYEPVRFTVCYSVGRDCTACWDREMPEAPTVPTEPLPGVEALRDKVLNKTVDVAEVALSIEGDTIIATPNPTIKDSGNRTEFSTGAVRDMHEGKGRCDLLPLDVVSEISKDNVLFCISEFQNTGEVKHLTEAIEEATLYFRTDTTIDHSAGLCTMLLEVAKHFEEGCKKYGENNWRKGIPVNCYIDSAVRHYLKYLRGDTDERHDRAFVWNILCCIWTAEHMPELNPYVKKSEENS